MAYIQDSQQSVQIQPLSGLLDSSVYLSQNENGRTLTFRLLGLDEIPAGSTATLAGTKPDGNVYSTTGTIDGLTVTVNEDVQMTAVAGTWDAKIKIINDGNTIATARIRFVIDPDPATGVESTSQLEGIVAECQAYAESARSAAYGSPLTASTVSAMTDITRVYVYTGSEDGYTAGNWYYYNGTAWVSGGVYNSLAVEGLCTNVTSGVLYIT